MENISNAQKIKVYYKELLNDHKEHSRIELFDYAQKNSGYCYTDGMLTGALRTLVIDTKEYSCTRRGWYKKVDTEENMKKKSSLIGAYIEILQDALKKCGNITSDPFYVMNMGQSDLKKMQKINDCLVMIEKLVEEI